VANDYPEEREALEAAMKRMLSRTGEQAKPTSSELARSIGMPLWKLNERYRDLNRAFQVEVKRGWSGDAVRASPDRRRLLDLEKKYADSRGRVVELEGLLEAYALAIEELRLQLGSGNSDAEVIPISVRRITPS
jgi:hypothetical protein